MYLALSWRNIWRNKKRTLITAASVFFAVLVAVVMRSAQHGSYSYMIHSAARLYPGYLQVQKRGFWENRSLDKSMAPDQGTIPGLQALPRITSVVPRLETFALVSFLTSTKVARVIGIEPEAEDGMTGLKNRLVKGAYLQGAGSGALVAAGLAGMLKVGPGDSITLYGQGYHGQTAAACVPVTGVVKMPFQEMNNGLVYVSLARAQEIYSAPGRVTSLALMTGDVRFLEDIITDVQKTLGPDQVIMTWRKMMPDLVQNIQLDNTSGLIMLVILYIVIAFGVFGTVMMMVSERLREFGILISVGMRKWKLVIVTTIETVLISFLGVAAGIAASIPLVLYLHAHPIHITGEATRTFDSLGIEPIFNFSTDPLLFVMQALIVLFIALSTAVYPWLSVWKLEPVEAMHA